MKGKIKWGITCADNDGFLVTWTSKKSSCGLLSVLKIGTVTPKQLTELEEKAIAIHMSMTEESEMLTIRVKHLRKYPQLKDAGIGAVGFIPINMKANDIVTVIAEEGPYNPNTKLWEDHRFNIWWLHLKFE